MYYNPDIDKAFNSVEYIIHNVNYGWLIKSMHTNIATIFFIVVYIHIVKNLLFKSYQKKVKYLWFTGIIILLLMIITAFLGMFYLGVKCLFGLVWL